ncbi:MAG: hypothetical protein JW860_14400 [Sedimentisphaerales bacterium]|nr:hypothetical protein [Sedimentisphaerales bacterium]
MIKFRCHNCNKKLGVQEDFIGRQVWCPKCTVATTVPLPDFNNNQEVYRSKENTQYSVFVCHGMADDD